MVPEKKGLRRWFGYVGPKFWRSVRIPCSSSFQFMRESHNLLSFIPIGVIWPIIVDQLINNRQLSLGWTLRTIGFLQLFLMVIATLLVSPHFPRIPREPIPVKQFLADKRTTLFTLSTLIFFFAVYIPYVRIE
jgi:predicted neutral ceramidase superfamily lipid hydrolase